MKGKLTPRNLNFILPNSPPASLVGKTVVPTSKVGDAGECQNFEIMPSNSVGTKNFNLHHHQKIQNWPSAQPRKFPSSFSLHTKIFLNILKKSRKSDFRRHRQIAAMCNMTDIGPRMCTVVCCYSRNRSIDMITLLLNTKRC